MHYRPFVITRKFTRIEPDASYSEEIDAELPEAASIQMDATLSDPEQASLVPLMLTFTEEEVASMLAAAVAEGRRLGAAKTAETAAFREAEAVAAVAASLERLEAEVDARAAEARAQTTEILQAVVRAFGATAAERLVADAAECLADHCLSHLPDGAVLELRVAPAAIDSVRVRLQPLSTRVDLVPDAGLEPGGVRASWKGGWAFHRPELLQAAVDRAFESLSMDYAREIVDE